MGAGGLKPSPGIEALAAPLATPSKGGAQAAARAEGVAAAFGTIVAIAFVASFDGTFAHLKTCASEDCRAVFYDRSKNHSGRWCSMEVCGNRAKMRRFRKRAVEDQG